MEYYRRGYGTLNPIVITWTESIFSVLFITIFQCFNFFSCKSVITERWQSTIHSQRWSGTKWKFIICKKQSWKKVDWLWWLPVAIHSTKMRYLCLMKFIQCNASRNVLCYRKALCYFPFSISHYFIFRSNECWHFIQHRPLIYQERVNQSLCFNNCIHEKKNTSIFIRLIDSFKKTNNNCIPKL